MVKKLFSSFFFLFGVLANLSAQTEKDKWVDSVFLTLNVSEKIAQLLIMPVSSAWDKSKLNDVEKQIRAQGIGGLLFTSGKATRQVSITNNFQSLAKVPMIIAMDAPDGPGGQLDSLLIFPNALSIGALASDSMVYRFGREAGRQLRLLGVQMNLAPNANLSTSDSIDSKNVYGEDPQYVSRKTLAFYKGLQNEGILSCANNFSLQGITISDVQKGLPLVKSFVDPTQAITFQLLIKNGIPAVMPAAKELPLFYETKSSARKNKFPGILISSAFAGDYLKTQMGHQGLVIVDVRPFQKNSGKLKNGEPELVAFQSGNELMITDNPSPAIRRIKKLLKKEKNYKAVLNMSVQKVLSAKYDAGLTVKSQVNEENLLLRINNSEAKRLQQQLFKGSITITRNDDNILPILALENKRVASIVIGDTLPLFHHYVSKYVKNTKVDLKKNNGLDKIPGVLKSHDLIIVAVTSGAKQSLVDSLVSLLKTVKQKDIIIADFGCAAFNLHVDSLKTVIRAFTNLPEAVRAIPQAIFGGIPTTGVMPVSAGLVRHGFTSPTKSLNRFEYSLPEESSLSSGFLRKIESIVNEAILNGATPGCQVLVAKDGKVVYDKSFGFLTYEKQTPVTDSTIYDLASVTKVSATLQAIMFLHDRGLIDINKKASAYLPELKNSNKQDFTLKDILTHQAGLWPFLPFWVQTMKDSVYLPEYYDSRPSLQYPYVVAEKLYASASIKDSLWSWIIHAKIREKPARTPYDYRYSDMGFYILQHLAEKLLNQPIEDFMQQNFFDPLGSYTTGYLPLLRFSPAHIAPTANDKLFRKSLLIGTVHDEGAAMHGGIAGHAGLFSTANDLAKLGQMLLQDGYYGGYRYFKPETIKFFTKKQFETSPRGLGWHKPVQSDWNSPTSIYASPATFGHTGFTGTCIWVDPEFKLVYIFLSNRVHPESTNNKLLNSNIRSRIQDVIYQSIFDYCEGNEGDLENGTLEVSQFSEQ